MVTLTCPMCEDFVTDEEHAKRILAHKSNSIAQWAIKDTNGTIGQPTNDVADSGKTEIKQVEGKNKQGDRPRGEAKAPRDANVSGK